MEKMATTTLRTLPPPSDGIRSVLGESTLQAQRGRQHPVGYTTRPSEHDPSLCGFARVVLMARWGGVRVPVALAPLEPTIKGPQSSRLRQRLKACVPPVWGRQMVVVAGLAANETVRRIAEKTYA
jgi:hypothetical protein